ncbi:MAG TPA: phosphoglycerate mutase family protein [Thermoanaerobaculia bacterium]|jgi:phosphohistidine phosphatase
MSTSKKAAAPRPERFVVFLRHGIAEEPSADKKDEDRGLTAEGHSRMKRIARGIESVLPKAQAIYASPLLRAIQTALWVSKAYRSRVGVTTNDALKPEATAKQFLALIKSIDERRVVIIGHEPVLTAGLHALTGVEGVELKKGGCYGVRIRPDGTASLEWVLPPRILRKLGV